MEADVIIINEYCRKSHIEPSFIYSLEEGGLIETEIIEGEKYLSVSQLRELERYIHLHYDLSINIEGIDAIRHMLGRISELRDELSRLRSQLRAYQSKDPFSVNG